MKDKLFLDSNTILYAFGEKGHEKEIAKDLIRKGGINELFPSYTSHLTHIDQTEQIYQIVIELHNG